MELSKAVQYSTAWVSRRFLYQFEGNQWKLLNQCCFKKTCLLCSLTQLSDIGVLWANGVWGFSGFFGVLIKGAGWVYSRRKFLPTTTYINLSDSGFLANMFVTENKLGLINSSSFIILFLVIWKQLLFLTWESSKFQNSSEVIYYWEYF